MAQPVGVFRHTFLDSAGRPLSGGRVAIYVSGTQTPATAYRDRDLLVPHEWPVRLDVGGRATIYLPAGTYDLVVSDRNNVVQIPLVQQVIVQDAASIKPILDLRSQATPPEAAGPVRARLYYEGARRLLWTSRQALPYRSLWAQTVFPLGGDSRAVMVQTAYEPIAGAIEAELDTNVLGDRRVSFAIVARITGATCGSVRLVDLSSDPPTEVAGSVIVIASPTMTYASRPVTLPSGRRRYRAEARPSPGDAIIVSDARVIAWGRIEGHTDVSHADGHADSAHTDSAHQDVLHTDQPHVDVDHQDAAHTDTHEDVAHQDVQHGDSHSDTVHTDTHGDSHADAPHQDQNHGDSPHGDTHHDDPHGDADEVNTHQDVTHSDAHSDSEEQNTHTDTHDDEFIPEHEDHDDDVFHQDIYFETHNDAHEDVHGDQAHGDSHDDVPHSDSHGDSPHQDVDHSDHTDSVPHTDSSHADSPHQDQTENTHGDVVHQDAHADSDHADSHTDTHQDVPHGDASHQDLAHGDGGHEDQPHGDAGHSDVHCDAAHADQTPTP